MKHICIITNKPTKWMNTIISWLNKMIIKAGYDSSFIYSCVVHDLNYQSLRIRKHEDGKFYMFGQCLKNDVSDYIDCNEFYSEIPTNRYIYVNKHPMIREDIHLKDYDTVIAIPEANDFESYLAIAAFLKNHHYDSSRTIRCLALQNHANVEDIVIQFLTRENGLPYFETEFAKIFNEKKKENFVSSFPISRDIRFLQDETHMTNAEFADFFGTSVRNIENWRKNPDSLKDFIYDLFEYKLLKEGII